MRKREEKQLKELLFCRFYQFKISATKTELWESKRTKSSCYFKSGWIVNVVIRHRAIFAAWGVTLNYEQKNEKVLSKDEARKRSEWKSYQRTRLWKKFPVKNWNPENTFFIQEFFWLIDVRWQNAKQSNVSYLQIITNFLNPINESWNWYM